jgi:pimeloyl-ACP methyl ester carboxylesterase
MGRAVRPRVPAIVFVVMILHLVGADPTEGQIHSHCEHAELPSGTIYYCVTGQGTDVVVLNAGARLDSRSWAPTVAALAAEATVVTFDRLGLGQSGASTTPRTPANIADEIAWLLAQVAEGPYVLVGHSAGGLHMLWFASRYPHRTRAVVLLDTPGPQFDRLRWELLTPAERVERRRLLTASRQAATVGVQQEYAGAVGAPLLPPSAVPDTIPLLVVAADTHEFGPHGDATAHERLWQAGQREWLEYSSRAHLLIAEGATHMIQRDRPDLVVQSVRQVLRETER